MNDLISRQEAIEATWFEPSYTDPLNVLTEVRDRLKALPSAQPKRIRGRWVEKPHVHGVAYCSLCDYELHTNDTNFCPNCGAKMEVGENAD